MLKHRSNQKELMDDLAFSGEVLTQTLQELDTINKLLGGNHVTLSGIKKLVKEKTHDEPLKIADLGCGGGNMLVHIAKMLRQLGIPASLYGVDANPNIVAYAKANTQQYPEINYLTHNIFEEQFQTLEFDIVTCTLFTHHFTNEELSQLFGQMHRQSRLGLVINDLQRHWFAYWSIKLLTQWFSRSAMVKNDAPISVARSFHKRELQSLLQQSGVQRYRIKWFWAFRWQIVSFK